MGISSSRHNPAWASAVARVPCMVICSIRHTPAWASAVAGIAPPSSRVVAVVAVAVVAAVPGLTLALCLVARGLP